MSKKDDSKNTTAAAQPELKSAPEPETKAATETAGDSGPTLQRKLSAKTIMGNVRKHVSAVEGENISLFSIMGMTHGIKDGTGDNGPWVAFLGTFEAVNYITGEISRGGQAFVPKALEDILVATVREQQKGDSNASVQFAIEVGVKTNSVLAIGYEYTVKSLLKMSGADPLEALRARLPPPPKLRLAAPIAA